MNPEPDKIKDGTWIYKFPQSRTRDASALFELGAPHKHSSWGVVCPVVVKGAKSNGAIDTARVGLDAEEMRRLGLALIKRSIEMEALDAGG